MPARKTKTPEPKIGKYGYLEHARGAGSIRAERIAANLATNPRDGEVNNGSPVNAYPRRTRSLSDGHTVAATDVDAAELSVPAGSLVAVADTVVVEELHGKRWVEVERRTGARGKF